MSEPVVETCSGKVRGHVEQSILGEDYFAFKGIPYAEPPVGSRRFRDPVPKSCWSGILDCKEYGSICSQLDWFTKKLSGSDDCLFLNVFAKNIETDIKRPVMVWIHGGGFIFGSGDDDFYGPDYLVRKEVILVTINYRLGVLGFLNLDSEVAPGNQGLKDQVLALQWVRDNIVNFGGDPNNVTIFGESAGGASVHYLTISPLAKGLFHKAICQSGVVFNPWASITNDRCKSFAYKLCKFLGKEAKNDQEVVDYLRAVDSLKLIEAQGKLTTAKERVQLVIPFGPGVDAESKNPFMPIHPLRAAEEGIQVPLLIGCTDREGIIFYGMMKGDPSGDMTTMFHHDLEKCLRSSSIETIQNCGRSLDDLKRLYFDSDQIDQNNEENIADLMGDLYFVEGIHRAIKIQVEKSSSPTYFYQYTYSKTLSPFKQLFNTPLKGSSHCDELQHIFRSRFFEQSTQNHIEEGTDSHKIMTQMVDLWVNFASTGRPTPTISELIPFYWTPLVSDTVLRYLNICEDLRMESTLNLEQKFLRHEVSKCSA
ncbi:hypothetical protein QAD02_018659 [Eretmocerus hayati]|uniref:Uncharacterized protein n=1 Tax=Eretmocerus hayati TaxID=131215 RepID=A0ACC2PHM8_9HYME|nr:hypothetical protein QAD02_018659 [Eretmocerus hayati]